MKTSLCFGFLAVRDERVISHAGYRNAYSDTLPPPGLNKRKGKSANMSQSQEEINVHKHS